MTFGERLMQLRKEKGFTRESFADYLEISKFTLRNYEMGTSEPNSALLRKLSKIFDVSIDYLLCATDEREKILPYHLKTSEIDHIMKYRDLDDLGREHVNSLLAWETQRVEALNKVCEKKAQQSAQIIELEKTTRPKYFISYYQRMASAGSGEYLFNDIPTDLIEVLDTPMARRADFVIGVNGQSMEPSYRDGDKVFVEKADEIPTGGIGVFLRGNECFIKELGNDRLISHNSDKDRYPDIPASEDIRCVGLVLGKVEED